MRNAQASQTQDKGCDPNSGNRLAHAIAAPLEPTLWDQFLKQFLRQALPIGLATVFVALLAKNIAHMQFANIKIAFLTVSVTQWGIAAVATAMSFWVIGRYDAVIHRHLATKSPNSTAIRAGIAAIAVSQTTGFGLFTGALARWRLLPDLGFLQCTQISAAVAASFFAGLATVLSITSLILEIPIYGLPSETLWVKLVLLAPFVGFFALVWASLFQPHVAFKSRKLHWPSLHAIFAITGLVAADTLAACGALYALLPPDLGVSFSHFYPAFLIAFAAALISGTPGGVGPFEITLLLAFPTIPAETLIGAILAYRLIYYAVPALLGALVLAQGPQNSKHSRKFMQETKGAMGWLPSRMEALIHKAPRAEANLLRQGEKSILHSPKGNSGLIISQRGQSLIALGDPISNDDTASLIAGFKHKAQSQNRIPFLYKTGARTAAEARRIGMHVSPVCKEAWLSPCAFDLAKSNHRQLRRKLRKAEKHGLSIKSLEHHDNLHFTLQNMTRVAQNWAQNHGGERGFSMGTYDPRYVQTQRCFLAYCDEQLVGFATFSTVEAEWTLDLMRYENGCPDGTMYALIYAAIQTAAREGIPRLSLASTPWTPHKTALLPVRKMWKAFSDKFGGTGLTQFKASFDPNWETLYMAAPNRIGLILGAFDVARAVNCNAQPSVFLSEDRKWQQTDQNPIHEPSSQTL